MSRPKPTNPISKYLGDPPPPPLARDVRLLRRLIRQTNRRISDGSIDFLEGGHLISRTYNSIARLLLAQHRIAPPQDPDGWAELRRMWNALLIESGYGPNTPTAPHDEPSPSPGPI